MNVWISETASGTKALREFGAEKVLSTCSASSAEDVAYAVIRGAALRQRSVYYPYYVTRVFPLLHHLMPSFFEKQIAMLYERN